METVANPTASPVEESVSDNVTVPPPWAKAKEKADIMPATKVMNFFKFIRNTQLINLTLLLTEKRGDGLILTKKKHQLMSTDEYSGNIHHFTRSGCSFMNFSQPPEPFTFASGLEIE